ncbi:pyruvate,orthophosphate dikinase [Roseiarcus fermentans]|uniref:Pyruvate,orthophosphate dikinase n=1 Tax=Roseiarcus fermentans TaxID=1473586 RepID=A0A366FQQ9_9HYPH|nr:pyruvate, phosphate dikinase [Roseiarcus fermentans]RBP16059.1 pyruvate,orthophosphate dikinase [Roseiarcus fermentans]
MAQRAQGPSFVRDVADPEVADAQRYGGKASGLSRMMSAGVPAPPAFVIGADGFRHFRSNGGSLGQDMMTEVANGLRRLEAATGRTFGGVDRPLLVSVRSGAAVSMPGMMDTILNLGLTARSALAVAEASGGARFALDTWLRFWRMFHDTVLNLDPTELVEAVREAVRDALAAPSLQTFEALERAILAHAEQQGETVSADPMGQLELAIAAVFRSWDSPRAKAYRAHHGISDDLGTAVTIQAMVFGNADEESGSGVAFTRNPNDGARTLYGEYLVGRQGEDLVAGTHSPIDLSDPDGMNSTLRTGLIEIGASLETLYRDAVDIEFTVESGRLYMLQVRPAKRTAAAAVRIAAELAAEGVIDAREALNRITVEQIRKLSRPSFEEADLVAAKLLAQGLGSSPGHAHGAAILDSDRAAEAAAKGEDVILVRPTTSPKDIRGMLSAHGVVTATGGALSHAAVVSRALDKPCIVGCEAIGIDLSGRTFTISGETFREGDEISIDGGSGKIYAGALRLRAGGASRAALERLLGLADAESGSSVWIAPRGAAEAIDSAAQAAPGLAVVRLTDLITSHGAIDAYAGLISRLGDQPGVPGLENDIAAIVRESSAALFEAARGLPVHVRLSRISSDRARRLIENWTEIPANLFMPLGSKAFFRALLRGLSDAARSAAHGDVRALIGNIVDAREAESFRSLTADVGLGAGAIIQNAIGLKQAGEIARHCDTVWVDVSETIRTAYGFPTEVVHADGTIDRYAADGFLGDNPFEQPAPFLTEWLQSVATLPQSSRKTTVGVDFTSGFSPILATRLHHMGFRRFAVSPAHRDEMRLILAQRSGE